MERHQCHCQQSTTERFVSLTIGINVEGAACVLLNIFSHWLFFADILIYIFFFFFFFEPVTDELLAKCIQNDVQMCEVVYILHWSSQLLQSLNRRPATHPSLAGNLQTAQTPTRLQTDTGERCRESCSQTLTPSDMFGWLSPIMCPSKLCHWVRIHNTRTPEPTHLNVMKPSLIL